MIIIMHRPNSISNHHHPILSVGALTHQNTHAGIHPPPPPDKHTHTLTSHAYGINTANLLEGGTCLSWLHIIFCRFMQSSQAAMRWLFVHCLVPLHSSVCPDLPCMHSLLICFILLPFFCFLFSFFLLSYPLLISLLSFSLFKLFQ